MDKFVEDLNKELELVRRNQRAILGVIKLKLNDLKFEIAKDECGNKLAKYSRIDDITKCINDYLGITPEEIEKASAVIERLAK